MQTILHFCLQALWNILLSKGVTATTAKLDAKATSNALALRNPVGITNSNGRYKNCRFSFINQALNRVRMFVF